MSQTKDLQNQDSPLAAASVRRQVSACGRIDRWRIDTDESDTIICKVINCLRRQNCKARIKVGDISIRVCAQEDSFDRRGRPGSCTQSVDCDIRLTILDLRPYVDNLCQTYIKIERQLLSGQTVWIVVVGSISMRADVRALGNG